MQFSLAPWDLGDECDRLCRQAAELHADFSPVILRLAQEAARTGQPIIRPGFWLAPQDERALLCDDVFLLGDDVLVAPVVHRGQCERTLHLPPGTWRDHWTDHIKVGPLEIQEYPAPMEILPIFHRISP